MQHSRSPEIASKPIASSKKMEEKQQLAPRLTLFESITVSVCARELCASIGPVSIQLSPALAGLCHHSRVSERPDSDWHVTPVRSQVAPAMPGYLGSNTGKASPGSRCLASTETQTRLLVTAGRGGPRLFAQTLAWQLCHCHLNPSIQLQLSLLLLAWMKPSLSG